jgi:hypothetical protein
MSLESFPPSIEKGKLWKRIVAYIVYFLFWIVLSVTGLWLMFEVRGLLIDLMMHAQLNAWAVSGIDRSVIFLLGLGWFIALMWIEYYLRSGIDKERLWRNIGRVAIVQAGMGILIYGIRFVIDL